jgi:hypothetical protein
MQWSLFSCVGRIENLAADYNPILMVTLLRPSGGQNVHAKMFTSHHEQKGLDWVEAVLQFKNDEDTAN